MTRRATCLGLAIAAYGAAAGMPAEGPRAAPAALVDRVARPFVLPALWTALGEASRRGDPAESIAAGRLIARLLPRWTDGLVHVAWICALDLADEAEDPTAAAERLLLGVGWLLEAATARADDTPEAAVELWLAAATLVDARTDRDPDLQRAFREHTGRDPRELSHELVDRAATVLPDVALESRRAFATLRLIVGAVRIGDLARAQVTAEAARRQLEALAEDRPARSAADALARLRPLATYLGDPAALAVLVQDPWLGDLGLALQDLRDG